MRMLWLAAALPAATGCFDLSDVESDVCGNGVLEAGEDCDGFAPEGGTCAAAGEASACFVVCAGFGTCPTGWGCGDDGVCRRPTGQFELGSEPGSFRLDGFAIGDVDGDGHADIIGNDLSEITVRYGDDDGTFGTTVSTSTRLPRGPIAFGHFDLDLRLDAIVPIEEGVVVMKGDASRVLQPVPFTSFPIGPERVAMVVVDAAPNGTSEVVAVSLESGAMGYVVSDDPIVLPDVAALTMPMAVSNIDDDVEGRDELALVFRGRTTVQLYTSTGTVADFPVGDLRLVELATLTLPAPAGAGALFADVDGDGDRDLIVELAPDAGGETRLAVALDQGATLADPVVVAGLNRRVEGGPVVATALPLASGDLTGDGRDDLVFADFIAVNVGPAVGLPLAMAPIVFPPQGTTWADAVVADVNGDGADDVAAGFDQITGLDFLVFTPGQVGAPNRFHLAGRAPVQREPRTMAVGDFDGDLVDDVAFVATGGGFDSASVAFGARSGGFGAIVEMGRFARLEQILALDTFTTESVDSTDDLFAQSAIGTAAGVQREIAVLFGDSSRSMIAPYQLLADEPRVPEAVAVGEFNADGHPDLMVVARRAEAFGSDDVSGAGEVWMLPGREGGIDASTQQFGEIGSYEDFDPVCATWAVGDVDDREQFFAELMGLDNSARCNAFEDDPGTPSRLMMIRVASADGASSSPTPQSVSVGTALTSPESLELTDLDGDGDADLLAVFRGDWWVRRDGDAPIPGAGVAVLWNNGGAIPIDYASPTVLPAGAGSVDFRAAEPLEIDGDGFSDVLVLTSRGLFQSLYDPVGGRFGELTPIVEDLDAQRLDTGDLDGDGLVDFAFPSAGTLVIGRQIPDLPLGTPRDGQPSVGEPR